MPLIKLNRINKGGEILINSDHISFIEVEGKSTTIHLSEGLLFSVEETLEAVVEQVERLAAARIANGIMESGVAANRD
jgi:uncharacterized protein YlzI (FlbEa/FlbD family)